MSGMARAGGSAGPAEDALGDVLDRTLLRRVAARLWPQRRLVALSLLLLPVAGAFEVAQPYLLKLAIDEHIAPRTLVGLDRLGLLYLAALLGQYGALLAQTLVTQIAGQRAMNDLRLAAYRHTLRLAQTFFDRTPIGRLMTRMTSDIESLAEMFAAGAVSLAGDAFKLALVLVAMFALDARLAAVSLLALPVLAGIAGFFRARVRDAFRDVRTLLARMNAFLQEHLQGMKVVQAFAQEDLVEARMRTVNHAYREANSRAIFADAALYALVEAVGACAVAGVLWYGGAHLLAGGLSFGVLVAFIEYLGKFFAPIRDLSTKVTVLQQGMAGAERVFGLLDTDELDAPGAPPAASVPGSAGSAPDPGATARAVAFEEVRFAYRAGVPVLDGLSFAVRPGETVALVGSSGAGKSTVARLLARFYEPGAGRITLRGQDVRAIPPAELRRRVVLVGQDPFLFSGNLRDNVAPGAAPDEDERVRALLVRLGAGSLLDRAGGLEAAVAERGANLSAGERQLLCFARALHRDPEVLVLDEATASVDPDTERRMESATRALCEGRTAIVIAHRLSTIARADRIIVLAAGRVADQGTHADLLARNPVYARLCAASAGRER